MEHLRRAWRESKWFRVTLVLAGIWAVMRLALQVVYVSGLLDNESTGIAAPDLNIYLTAARQLQERKPLYLEGPLPHLEFYQYSPAYALAFIPFLWLPPAATIIIHFILHIGAYVLLYVWWQRIFSRMQLARGQRILARSLPLWLVFTGFWGDLAYLNIYIIMALLGTLLIAAVMEERLGWAFCWLAIILQTKPQWAFAIIVPLLLGRRHFFFRLVGLSIVGYFLIAGVTLIAVGPEYGWRQYDALFRFLWNLSANFPWRGPEAPFLGYNHSVKQIVIYWLGMSAITLKLVTALKVVLLTPLVWISVRHLVRPVGKRGGEVPYLALDLAFAWYLAAFIWLDMVWELSLGIALMIYIWAVIERPYWLKLLGSIFFMLYAFQDWWQALSFMIFGMDVLTHGDYLATDPFIYLPLLMAVILAFYAVLVIRLWSPAAIAAQATESKSLAG